MRLKLNITFIILIMFILFNCIAFASADNNGNSYVVTDDDISHIEIDNIEEIDDSAGNYEENNQNPFTENSERNYTDIATVKLNTDNSEANNIAQSRESDAKDYQSESNDLNCETSEDSIPVISKLKEMTDKLSPETVQWTDRIVYVDGNAKNIGDGSEDSPFLDIYTAYLQASDGDTILIKPGTYTGFLNTYRTFKKNLNIGRWGDYGEVIFDGEEHKIFHFEKSVILNNIIFKNGVNDFGGAVCLNRISIINNCTFINNRARYGGAVSVNGTHCNFRDCIFVDNVASLGGGAIFDFIGNTTINRSSISNCISQIGGAIFSLYGNLNLYNSNITSNQALAFGGGIYKKSLGLTIVSSSLINNSAYYDGGGIYIIKGTSMIMNSLLEKNFANYNGEAIHSVSSWLIPFNSIFQDNGASSLGTSFSAYLNPFIDLGNYTMIISDTSNFNGTIPSYYNLVDQGWVTSIKDQGPYGLCWAFATIAVVESAVKKATGIELDLSEAHVKNMVGRNSPYGTDKEPNSGDYSWTGFSYLFDALGPVLEASDPYDPFGFSPLLNNVLLVSNILNISRNRDDPSDNNKVKETIMKYGAIRASMNTKYNNGYNYYQTETTATTHAVAIVGWNDNYSRNHFGNDCPGDGAWIVKNSWGEYEGDHGYIYVSYYDKAFAYDDLIYVIFNNTMKFDRIYQYDYGMPDEDTIVLSVLSPFDLQYKNVFKSVQDEDLAAFSTMFNNEHNEWEVSVYVNDKLTHCEKGITEGTGFFTINFNRLIPLQKGDTFAIIVKINSNTLPIIYTEKNSFLYKKGVSFYSTTSGLDWIDLGDEEVAILKAYTVKRNSLININPIADATINEPIKIGFNIQNPTVVDCILKKEGEIISEMKDIKGNEIIFNNLSIGNYEITINNKDSISFKGSSQTAHFTVNKIPSLIEIEDIPSIIYGNNLTVHFNTENVSNPIFTYTVTYNWSNHTINGRYIANETNKSINLPILETGDYSITIYTPGDDMHANSSTTKYFKVLKSKPVVTIDVCDGSNAEEFKINITSDITEKYLIKIGNISKFVGFSAPGTKTVTIKNIPTGNYTISLEFVETRNYEQMKKYFNATVVKASPNLTINDVLCSNYQKNKTVIDYNLSHDGKASVILTNRDTGEIIDMPMEITEKQITLEGLSAGNYTMTLFNKGNEIYNDCSESVNFSIYEDETGHFGCDYQTANISIDEGNLTIAKECLA